MKKSEEVPQNKPIVSHCHTAPDPKKRKQKNNIFLHFILFILTLFSMIFAGAMQQGVAPITSIRSLQHLVEGIPFALTLLTILTVHEFGHYFAARHWDVRASLPYFIPLPYISFLGTLGAVIKIRDTIPNKSALLEIGAAGPLAGFVVAICACLGGVSMSKVVNIDYVYSQPIELGTSVVFSAITSLILPDVGTQEYVLLHPVAFAGWVGLFVTTFNLIPIGQLDGGHIVYALFDKTKSRIISQISYYSLIVFGCYGVISHVIDVPWERGWPGWLALAFFLTFVRKNNPATRETYSTIDQRHQWIGYLCIIIFFLCFVPVPFSAG
ncbi:MAG: site-2 protease family protein [Candidatus Latescibacterota bacterium]|nr:site-2 protease family protein [Candidatus Latescibacterota bacterium]